MSKILRMPDVLDKVGVSRTTIWRQVKAGIFPSPIRLSARSVGWRENEVDEWLDAQPAITERD